MIQKSKYLKKSEMRFSEFFCFAAFYLLYDVTHFSLQKLRGCLSDYNSLGNCVKHIFFSYCMKVEYSIILMWKFISREQDVSRNVYLFLIDFAAIGTATWFKRKILKLSRILFFVKINFTILLQGSINMRS